MKKFLLVFLILTVTVVYGQSTNQKGYEGNFSAGFAFGVGFVEIDRIVIDIVNGYRFNPYVSIGAGVGYRHYLNDNYINVESFRLVMMPLYGNIKVNFTDTKYAPFLSISTGYSISLIGEGVIYNRWEGSWGNGYFLNPQIGLNVALNEKSALFLSVGYELQLTKVSIMSMPPPEGTSDLHAITVSIGVQL
jgi:hypothetical protein